MFGIQRRPPTMDFQMAGQHSARVVSQICLCLAILVSLSSPMSCRFVEAKLACDDLQCLMSPEPKTRSVKSDAHDGGQAFYVY